MQLPTHWAGLFSTNLASQTDGNNVVSQYLMNVPAQNWCDTTDYTSATVIGE